MKRTILLVVILLVAAVGFTSCKKCMTCTAYENTTDIQVYQDHLCDQSIVVNNWVDDFKTEWDYGPTYAVCERD